MNPLGRGAWCPSKRRTHHHLSEWEAYEEILANTPEVESLFVSELCQIPPETPVKHRDLRGHSDAHRCCGKSLIGRALVRFGVGQHARAESISKSAADWLRKELG